MTVIKQAVNTTIKGLTRLLCWIDEAKLSKVPTQGPLIIAANHINFLEVPLLYTHLQPRPLTGFAKVESWNSWALGTLFNMWEFIPLERGEADLKAFRKGLEALEAGKILVIAPEGTRSHHGKLQRAHPGIVTLALRSHAPILPFVFYGNEKLKDNLKRIRKTNFHINIGQPFTLHTADDSVTRDTRRKMVDEIMYQIAALLPTAYRGHYADFSKATEHYLHFVPPHQSLSLNHTYEFQTQQ